MLSLMVNQRLEGDINGNPGMNYNAQARIKPRMAMITPR